MDKRVDSKLELTNCTIGRGSWRNFTGEKGRFNNEGEYGFTVFLPEHLYNEMGEEGWNVKHKEQFAGDEREFQLSVAFTFGKYPPHITMISDDGSTAILNEDNISLLQTADFERCDIIIRPYNWTNPKGEHGVKAYLDSMSVWIRPPRRSYVASFGEEEEE